MDYVATYSGQYVADITINPGGALTWSGPVPVNSSQPLALGTLSGQSAFSLADASSGATSYSVTIHELPVVISGLTFGYSSVELGPILPEFSISGDTTITAYILNGAGQTVRHLGSYSAPYYGGAGTTPGSGPDIWWDLVGDGGVALPNGTYYLRLVSTDPNGSVTSAETSIVLDQPNTPPASKYRVPILRGRTLAQARSLLSAHFKLGRVYRVRGSGVPVGKILRASPAGGSSQEAGTVINVWIRKR
jgi:hypothetical protein